MLHVYDDWKVLGFINLKSKEPPAPSGPPGAAAKDSLTMRSNLFSLCHRSLSCGVVWGGGGVLVRGVSLEEHSMLHGPAVAYFHAFTHLRGDCSTFSLPLMARSSFNTFTHLASFRAGQRTDIRRRLSQPTNQPTNYSTNRPDSLCVSSARAKRRRPDAVHHSCLEENPSVGWLVD